MICVDTNAEGQSLYNRYLSSHSNRYNKRKFVDGALYTRIFMNHADVIMPRPGCVIELQVTIEDTGITSSVYIMCDVNISNSYLMSLNRLGDILSNEKPNTYRKKKNDMGSMYIVGNGKKGDGTSGVYNLTNSSERLMTVISKITKQAELYYQSIGLDDDIETMKQSRCCKKLCNNLLFVSSIVQSSNLINAAHIDPADITPSIVTFTEPNIGSCSDWYFILPHTTHNVKKAIVIALRHGVSIRWEGQQLFHCSSVSDHCSDGTVYGTYFGVKKLTIKLYII